MSYTVIWKPKAEQDLAQIWLSASDQNQVTNAANKMDALLAYDPMGQGESREGDLCVFFEYPLAIYFRVVEKDKKVEIGAVWQFQVKNP